MWASLTTGVLSSILGRALLALGIGFLSFAGFNEVLQLALSQVQAYLNGLPLQLLGLLGWCHADRPISAIFAGYAAALAMSAASRFVTK